MVPYVELPPVVPFTCQVTSVVLVLVTVVENCCDVLIARVTEVGEIAIVISDELEELLEEPPHDVQNIKSALTNR
jgi:hypothetical protein